MRFLDAICCIFLPPLAVYLHLGPGSEVALNFGLWCFLWIPASIHAFYLLKTRPAAELHDP